MKKELLFFSAAAFFILSTAIGVREAAGRSCDITVPTDYGTVEEALTNAAAGNKICIMSGTYPENALTIDKANLHIVGSGWPVIQMSQDASTVGPNISIEASGVMIEKVKFEFGDGTVPTIGISVGATNMPAPDVVIRKNRFMVYGGDGTDALQMVAIQSVENEDISRLEISKNRFDGLGTYTGIYLSPDDTASNNGDRVKVDKNRFEGDVHMAIGTGRSFVDIEKNKMTTTYSPSLEDTTEMSAHSIGIGLLSYVGTPPTIEEVEVEKNKIGFQQPFSYGIYMDPMVTSSSVEKNYVKGADIHGIWVSGDANKFFKNKARNAAMDGIYVDGNNNEFNMDIAKGNGEHDVHNDGTGNTFFKEKCDTDNQSGAICN